MATAAAAAPAPAAETATVESYLFIRTNGTLTQ